METVSVIVPAFNAESTILRCVAALQAMEPAAVEIIVVDDGSTDATGDLARGLGVQVIRLSRNSGPGVARNAGARAAKGECLAFTDADCEVPPDWLITHVPLLGDPRYSAVTGPFSASTVDAVLPELMDLCLRHSHAAVPDTIESSISANLFVWRAAFLSVNGFPEYWLPRASKAYYGNEDEEFALLLARHTGKPLRWVREHGPQHAYRPGVLGYLKQQALYAESILVSYARFPAVVAGHPHYSRVRGVFRVCSVWIAITGAMFLHGMPVLLSLLPFLAIHAKTVGYVIESERRPVRRVQLALCGYPFLFTTGLAWSIGLASGVIKGTAGFFYWRVLGREPVHPHDAETAGTGRH